MQHAVLHVDEAGEGQLREHLPAVWCVLDEAQEHAVGGQDVAALHERQPMVESLADRPVESHRLLIRPVRDRHRRRLVDLDLVEPRVVARRLAEQLVPRVEPARNVPDRLGQRQHREIRPDQ